MLKKVLFSLSSVWVSGPTDRIFRGWCIAYKKDALEGASFSILKRSEFPLCSRVEASADGVHLTPTPCPEQELKDHLLEEPGEFLFLISDPHWVQNAKWTKDHQYLPS